MLDSRLCPECVKALYDRLDRKTGFTEYLCWVCGHYASDSPAFRASPTMFTNLLRERIGLPTKLKQPDKTTKDGTEPTLKASRSGSVKIAVRRPLRQASVRTV